MLTDYYTPFTLYQKSNPSNSFTGSDYTAVSGAFTGFIQPIGGNETFRDGKGGESATHRLYTNVTYGIVYGDRVEQNSQTYTVLYAIQPTGISGVSHHKEIIMAVFE